MYFYCIESTIVPDFSRLCSSTSHQPNSYYPLNTSYSLSSTINIFVAPLRLPALSFLLALQIFGSVDITLNSWQQHKQHFSTNLSAKHRQSAAVQFSQTVSVSELSSSFKNTVFTLEQFCEEVGCAVSKYVCHIGTNEVACSNEDSAIVGSTVLCWEEPVKKQSDVATSCPNKKTVSLIVATKHPALASIVSWIISCTTFLRAKSIITLVLRVMSAIFVVGKLLRKSRLISNFKDITLSFFCGSPI